MDDKKKIVLATEDIIAKNLEDIFINVNLQQKFNQIRREKFDNNFDLSEQFRKERNASRSFRVYGIVDSPAVDCNNQSILVYSDSGLTQLIQTINTSSIGFGDKNVFGKYRGKYIIELNSYISSNDIWIKVNSDGANFGDTIIKVPLVFYGADGDFIEYGTDTIDIGLIGDFVTINNDFPFFYNKHWIKNNFQLEKIIQKNISFSNDSITIEEGSSGDVIVFLNEPSFFGNESVDVFISSSMQPTYYEAAESIDFEGSGFTFPITINWAVGEQYKTIPISTFNDFIYEKNIEYFTLSLSGNQNSTIGEGIINISSINVEIENQDEKRFVNYNFQKIIQNTTPLRYPNLYSENLTRVNNGVKLNVFGAQYLTTGNTAENHRFYPADKFEVTITNKGNTTVLPIIPGINTSEQIFEPNQSFTLMVDSQYLNQQSLPLERAVLKFKYQSVPIPVANSYNGNFYINGIEFGETNLVANNFIAEINRVYGQLGIEMPFTISQNGTEVSLTSKHPANNINILIPSGTTQVCTWVNNGGFLEQLCVEENRFALTGDSQTATYPEGRISGITSQIPYQITLNSNFANNSECRYEFHIQKPGYKNIVIPPQGIAASNTGNDAFLVSGLKNIVGPTMFSGGQIVCSPSTSAFESEGYYINGVALLASTLSNTSKNNLITIVYPGASAVNESENNFVAEFRTSPLSVDVITCNSLIGISKILS